ncbi:MAG: GlxA family transcriptional regulator [Pseudomonadota bacterium]
MDKARTTHVGVLAMPGFAAMSLAALTEPLRAANLLGASPPYRVEHLSPDDQPVSASGGMVINPTLSLEKAANLGTLFVVAGGDPMGQRLDALAPVLRSLAVRGVRLGGVSGGPVILARLGLMAGRRMTVHWEHADALAEAFPDLALERTLFVIDRDRITCAGGTAPLDMMHAIIASDHGAALAQTVSDWFLHTQARPSTGAQRAGLAERLGTTHPAILAAVSAMEADPSTALTLPQLAAQAGVSPRQLSRLFKEKLNDSPLAYGRRMRLALARRLITGSSMPLSEVAYACGFASASHFARLHREAYGEAPGTLRR